MISLKLPHLPYCATKFSPTKLSFNRKVNTRLNFIKPGLSSQIKNHEEHFYKFCTDSKTLRCLYPSHNAWVGF